MKTIDRQRGMTAISLAGLLAILAFFVLIALKLVPIYLDHFKVASHLEAIANDHATANMEPEEISKVYFKRLDIDDVESVKPENLFIEKPQDGKMVLAVEYEVRRPMLGNVDVVVSFVEEFEVK